MHVSYGPIEVNEEIKPVLRVIQSSWDPWAEPFIHEEKAYRKRRYETWVENGEKWGRWTWVPFDHSERDAS